MQLEIPDHLIPFLKLAIIRAQVATKGRESDEPEDVRHKRASRELDRLATTIWNQTPAVTVPLTAQDFARLGQEL